MNIVPFGEEVFILCNADLDSEFSYNLIGGPVAKEFEN